MLRSNKLIQSRLVSKFLGGNSNSAIEISKYSGVRYTSTSPSSKSTEQQALPDPSKAILKNKYFHYSTIGVAVCLPATLLLPASGITFATDCILSVVLPTHIFFGLSAVINDYIYQPVIRSALCASGIVALGVLFVSSKHGSFGTVIQQLWTK